VLALGRLAPDARSAAVMREELLRAGNREQVGGRAAIWTSGKGTPGSARCIRTCCDPSTTTIDDRRRQNLDRHAAYVVVAVIRHE
jgi:hypothetical protein